MSSRSMARRVIAYDRSMGRWSPDARGRLERAAVELFVEQGFAATTVPQITARAGLTTRTFFRYFADKREVFFAGDEIPDLARRYLTAAPAGRGARGGGGRAVRRQARRGAAPPRRHPRRAVPAGAGCAEAGRARP